jgi:hypothetical protein
MRLLTTEWTVILFMVKITCLMAIDVFILTSVFSAVEAPLLKAGIGAVPSLILGAIFALATGAYLNYRHTIRASWLSTKGLP